MNANRTNSTALLAALLLAATASFANATPVTVPNASFETPASPASSNSNPNIIGGWVFNVKNGSYYGTESISSNFNSGGASSGANAAFINNDYPDVTDTITSASSLGTITPLTTYTLTVAIGNLKNSDTSLYGAPGNTSFSLLANGVPFATDTITNGTVPNGTFEDFTLTFTTPASGSVIGDNLAIQLAALPEEGTAYKPAFDNVTLDATTQAVPEPATRALLVAGFLALGWKARLRRAMVVSTFILSAAVANATPVAIPNASFENPSTPTGGDGAPIPGWIFNSQSGNLYGTAPITQSFKAEGAASGSNYAFMFNDVAGDTDTISSAASIGVIQPNTKYTLTVAVGNVGGSDSVSNHSPGNISFSLLANGIAFATDTVPNGTVPDATFEDFSLTFQTPSSGSIIGENLGIQLASLPTPGPGSGPTFDNVTLDATGIAVAPEPPTWSLLMSGALALIWRFRQQRRCHALLVRLAVLGIMVASLGFVPSRGQAIKTFPLDEHLVYHLKVSPDKPTTIMFPGPITDLEGSGITTDPKTPAKVLLSYHPGERFFSLRALVSSATASLNVIANHKTYVLEMATDPVPFQSVTFYDSTDTESLRPGQHTLTPDRLLALLDEAKAYPLLKDQYPEVVAQIDHAEPLSPTLYPDFTVVLASVYRFDPEDTLIFRLELQNNSDHPIYYVPQSLAVRVGPQVYWSALADASGVMPPGHRDPDGKIEPSHSFAYFVICGTPQGGRNHLAVSNHFNVLVFRQEKS